MENQEVILRIGPLGKLGHFESTAEIFLVYIASISLASGPILSITSWVVAAYHVDIGEERLVAGVLHAAPARLEIVAKIFGAIVDVICQKFLRQIK
jgi:hypothetical protein